MTNYFELYTLPVSFSPDQAVAKTKFYELSRLYHPDRFAQTGGAELAEALRMAALNNEAYKTFKNADKTMAYILKLHNMLEDEEKYSLPPLFLMEMMDINEAVSDYESVMTSGTEPPANQSAGTQAANALQQQMQQWEDDTAALTGRFDDGDHGQPLLLQIKDQYFRKKYLLRIKERIDRFAAR